MKSLLYGAALALLLTTPAFAESNAHHHHHNHHAHHSAPSAPIGIMGDHLHEKGSWMASYRLMSMEMDGMRDGTDELTSQEVFARGFTVTPTDMHTKMHMFSLMHAPTDTLTIMAMITFRLLKCLKFRLKWKKKWKSLNRLSWTLMKIMT